MPFLIHPHNKHHRTHYCSRLVGFLMIIGIMGGSFAYAAPESDQVASNSSIAYGETTPQAPTPKRNYIFTEAMGKSIWGDVYAHPEDW